MSALMKLAVTHIGAEHDGFILDEAETEMALAVYSKHFDNQMAGARGVKKLFPDGRSFRKRRESA